MTQVIIAKVDGKHRYILKQYGMIDDYVTDMTIEQMRTLLGKVVAVERDIYAYTLLTYIDDTPVRATVRLEETTRANETIIQYIMRCESEQEEEQMSLF